ncbi:hypothetical protein CONLIGDRAFT_645292 [Coniochaeta ligniaria NRRL 30616]|uniref:Uncharacterized protein n=1 Tax=Coniochaeta ligniaria NRRL 30616 TaxID=1408157 RepID=A0A1J7JHE0_9PEZI|nr:hypothetical protein CONLIGDRAFT_645292 [Coniochaeta ligniaria NRRL 30616]
MEMEQEKSPLTPRKDLVLYDSDWPMDPLSSREETLYPTDTKNGTGIGVFNLSDHEKRRIRYTGNSYVQQQTQHRFRGPTFVHEHVKNGLKATYPETQQRHHKQTIKYLIHVCQESQLFKTEWPVSQGTLYLMKEFQGSDIELNGCASPKMA